MAPRTAHVFRPNTRRASCVTIPLEVGERTETLDALLSRGRLSEEKAARIAANLARYLCSMHSAGESYLRLSPRTLRLDQSLNVHLGAGAEPADTDDDLAYRAPEQVEGRGADWRSDCWSVGVLFYRMFTGTLPFWGGTTAALEAAILADEPPELTLLAGTLPPEMDNVLKLTLAKSPQNRYPRTEDLVRDLESLCRIFVARSSVGGGVPSAEISRIRPEDDLRQRFRSARSELARRKPPSWSALSFLPMVALLFLILMLLLALGVLE